MDSMILNPNNSMFRTMNDLEIGRQTKNVLDSMIEYIGY